MAEQIDLLRKKFEDSILQVKDASELETLRVNFLGKSGHVTALLKGMGKLSPDEKKTMGQAVNTFKQSVADAIGDSGVLQCHGVFAIQTAGAHIIPTNAGSPYHAKYEAYG